MEQGFNIIKEEATEMMNVEEVARAIEWFKAMGLSDSDACNFLTYIATGRERIRLTNRRRTR